MAIHQRSTQQTEEDPNDVPRFTRAGMLKVPKNRLPHRPMLPQTWRCTSPGRWPRCRSSPSSPFSPDMAGLFLRDLRGAVAWLDALTGPIPHEGQPSGFHH